MSFQTPITIAQGLGNIKMRKYLLPSIQRGVVWGHEQIERLFDSLMQDYPIGSFVFWRVDKEYVNNYRFYEFLDHYHERDTIDNNPVNGKLFDDIIGILDGQQRLTALNVGLSGWYAYKTPWKRWDNDAAFQKRHLYLNLLGKKGRDDLEYDFRFLSDEEVNSPPVGCYWYKVGDMLPESNMVYVLNYVRDKKLDAVNNDSNKNSIRTPLDILSTLYSVIHSKPVINYFLETSQDLNKVLNIFIRVNSGGTQLSYSDLLLSIASASWQQKNAREEIYNLVKEINEIGDKFNFDKDVILKACLVMCDFSNIEFNINNFNNKNMLIIENKWDDIATAIRTSVRLLASMGFNRDTLTANNAIIPIAYYVLLRKLDNGYISDIKEKDDRATIQKWLSVCLLKRIFGSHADGVLSMMRDEIRKNVIDKKSNLFPFDMIRDSLKGDPTKSLIFSDDDIENLFTYSYGQPYTFLALGLLYPWLDYRNHFHIDHMNPKSKFTKKEFMRMKLTDQQAEFYKTTCNNITNLQLLEGKLNQQKSDMSFSDWLDAFCKTPYEKDAYLKKHFIDSKASLDFADFEDFIKRRKDLLKNEFGRILQ